jgi:ABC-2 type transport system ATP-binding protein
MANEYAIETGDLTKVFRSRWSRREVRAVNSVSLKVERGTTFGLLGPNGAGKTTFVKLLLSSVHATSGEARIFGKPVSDPEARRPIGYLPENHRFPTYFTGAGMLDCYAALSGLSAADRKRLIPELLARVGLEKWGDMRLGKYSKGMLQRVGLAQALIHAPQLLILDEPTDGVDPVGRIQIREILNSLTGSGVTVFLNSHLLAEVQLYCRDVAILHKGQVALQGSVKELTAGQGYRVTAQNGRGPVEEFHSTREDLNAAIDRFRAAGCEIESVIPTSSSLEDVFIRTVGTSTSAGGDTNA